MSGYLERLKKNSALTGAAETAKSLCDTPSGSFGSFGSEGNAEFFLSEDDRPNPSGSFGSSPPWEFVDFSAVRCCDCLHSSAATASDPYSWHSCRVGQSGWWGMAPHRCEDWKAADHAEERPAPDPLALELATLAGLGVARMLAGRLVTDSEWSGFADGLAKLNERYPDKAAEIAALVDRVSIAAEALEGAP